ncbi:MAG: MFS transporter, partial [Chloroflexi bacterium]|nr:MFS transporter [Chloroflexota bacterium]
ANLTLLRACMLGGVVGALLLTLSPTPTVGFIGLVVLGFSLAPVFPTLIAETPKRVGRRHAANAIGFQIGVAGLGASILVGFAAWLASAVSPEVIGPFLMIIMLVTFALHERMIAMQMRATTGAAAQTAAGD